MSCLNSLFMALGISCVCILPVSAGPLHLDESLSGMNRVGSATFRFMFWSIYEAELYTAQSDFDFDSLPEFVLSFNYQRSFTSDQIIKETEKQLTALNQTSTEDMHSWLTSLAEILVDVNRGDQLSLFVDADGHSAFYLNNTFLGQIEAKDFSKNFSAIWLDRDDQYASFSRKLTGQTS